QVNKKSPGHILPGAPSSLFRRFSYPRRTQWSGVVAFLCEHHFDLEPLTAAPDEDGLLGPGRLSSDHPLKLRAIDDPLIIHLHNYVFRSKAGATGRAVRRPLIDH